MDRSSPVRVRDAAQTRPERPTVLVVDDQPFNIQHLYQILRKDHEVLMAGSGPQALALCRQRSPDLVLLDLGMPGMDGLAVCREMRNETALAHIPVVMVTARDAPEDRQEAFDSGASGFLLKPVVADVLRAEVRRVLSGGHAPVEVIASVDPETGLVERVDLDHALRAEWQRITADAGTAPLSLALIEIDAFESLRRHHGVAAGRACLMHVAEVLRSEFDIPGQVLARYGEAVFAAMMPETAAETAGEYCETLRAAVVDLRMPHPASVAGPHVTVSIGLATAEAMAERAGSPEDLQVETETQLVRARRFGRNRVEAGELA